ncbi:hypothetical protein HK096_006042 [Nowakowskiella sp. JEL0078]|nr:hypothetical protein HK096_006042 [Nowakowskiella sp. JEL0078]
MQTGNIQNIEKLDGLIQKAGLYPSDGKIIVYNAIKYQVPVDKSSGQYDIYNDKSSLACIAHTKSVYSFSSRGKNSIPQFNFVQLDISDEEDISNIVFIKLLLLFAVGSKKTPTY